MLHFISYVILCSFDAFSGKEKMKENTLNPQDASKTFDW